MSKITTFIIVLSGRNPSLENKEKVSPQKSGANIRRTEPDAGACGETKAEFSPASSAYFTIFSLSRRLARHDCYYDISMRAYPYPSHRELQ